MGRFRSSLLLAALSFLTQRAAANDSAMGGHGGSLVPITESRVVMVSEDIELTYEADEWDVAAHYVFRNETDARVRVRMGFPETHCDGEGDCVMAEGDVFENMRTLVRGKEVPRKKGKLSPKHAWAPKLGMVWLYDVIFAPHEQLEIDHEYTTLSGIDVMGTHFTTYVTRTGALWGKPIERATFRVVLPASARQLHEPEGIPRIAAERRGGDDPALVLTYEARNWTPEGDFHIGFSQRVDWYSLQPTGSLKDLRCDALFSLYLVAEADDGRAARGLDLPEDAATLRLCRNAIYAQYGRRFRDEALNQYFYGPEGFAPHGPAVLAFEPNPDYSDALLGAEDRKVLAMITERERALASERAAQPSAPELAHDRGAEATVTDPESAARNAARAAAASPQAGGASAEGTRGGCGDCSAGAGGPRPLQTTWLWALGLLWIGRRRAC